MGVDGCRIISLPKIQFYKHKDIPVLFKALSEETIDKFVHRFVKFLQKNSSLMSVDISGNKLMGKSVIEIILEYSNKLVKEINFKGCLFGFN